jgi:hypothetical protein
MKINKKVSLHQFLALSEAEIQGLLHQAQANLGYFLAWFQSLQLPSTQSQSPLAPKSHAYFVVQTGSGAHPTSYPIGTGGFFPGGEAA